MGANVVISTIKGANKNIVKGARSSSSRGFSIGCSLMPYLGVKDSVPTRGVCSWEELSQWDSTKAKAVMVVPRLDDSNMDTRSPKDGLLMAVRGRV